MGLTSADTLDTKEVFQHAQMDPDGILAESIPVPKTDDPTTEHNMTEKIIVTAAVKQVAFIVILSVFFLLLSN